MMGCEKDESEKSNITPEIRDRLRIDVALLLIYLGLSVMIAIATRLDILVNANEYIR
jgi:hypothetical protein